MHSRRAVLWGGVLAPVVAGLAGCAGERRSVTSQPLRLLVPNAPGGGYDTTARVLAGAIGRDAGGGPTEVFNLPGGGGIVGLARLSTEHGNPDLMMMMGLGVVGAVHAADPSRDLGEVTPLARLLGEAEVVLVRGDSHMTSFEDLREVWRERPRSVRVGGGSMPGGPDHLATYAIAQACGVPSPRVRYLAFDGGGPQLAALLAGRVDVAVSGVLETIDQVRSGAIRPLAVTSAERVALAEVPTLREQGLDVEFENWRGVLGPPGLSAGQRDHLVTLLEASLTSPEWSAAARRNGWSSRWLAGDAFGRFLRTEEARTARVLAQVDGVRPPA